MAENKQTAMARATGDPFGLLRQMRSEFDRMFDDWPAFRWPGLRGDFSLETTAWAPRIDVFEKDKRLVTRVDLPGMKKEDVSVEIAEGCLALSGERKRESEERKDNFYRNELEYGRFYRAVPLPEGVKPEEVKASFADGVLEVSIPLPARPQEKARKIAIEEPRKGAKSAA